MRRVFGPILVSVGMALAACGPGEPEGAQLRSERPAATKKTLTIALGREPEYLLMAGLGGGEGASQIAPEIRPAVHQALVAPDDRGAFHPQLAVELPSQARGTWVVRPDGSMRTTYQLRPGVSWHDGAPLTATDFALGWAVSKDPELPKPIPLIARQIERIDTPDDLTVILEWNATNPYANAIAEDELGPLPSHLLESIYRANKERFQQLPYWKREFIGVGPYRLVEWEHGSHLTLAAYDAFYAGRPRIDTLVVRFISDSSTLVANLLAGTLDGTWSGIDFSEVMLVKKEWEQAGRKPLVVLQTSHWRLMSVQFRDPTPRDILDVRVRRALLHGLDRQGLVDALFEGQAPVSHTFIPPDEAQWEWVRDVVARYDHDLRRAEELLSEVGWRRATDGALIGAGGERVRIPVWTTGGARSEDELAVIGANWKTLGIDVDQVILGQAQTRDSRLRASFPAFDTTQLGLSPRVIQRVYGPECPTEQRRWQGSNRGCYQNPDMDRLVEALQAAIEPDDQQGLLRQLVHAQTDLLPVLPLYFNIRPTIFREGVSGVKGISRPVGGGAVWNVSEWDVR